jgi:hypothetical protein
MSASTATVVKILRFLPWVSEFMPRSFASMRLGISSPNGVAP